MSEDEKRTCVVLRHPAGLVEPDQKGEPWVSVEDGEREDKGEKQNTQTRTWTVRWYKAVDGHQQKNQINVWACSPCMESNAS